MPAKPDVIDEDLEPWSGALASRFVIEDALVAGDFDEVRAAGGRIVRSRLDRVVLTGARLRSLALIDVVATGCEASGADWSGARLRRVVFDGAGWRAAARRGRARGRRLPRLPARAGDLPRRGCATCVFERCVLDEAFLGRGTMQAVRFEGCRLLRADFTARR